MRTDVRDRTQVASEGGVEPPVPVGVEEEPVLEVVPRDQAHLTQLTRRDHAVHMLAERVEAQVVVDGVHPTTAVSDPKEVGRLGRGHGEGLLADDVLARFERGLCLLVVEVVRRGDVDDLDPPVVEHGLEALIRGRQAELPRPCGGALMA